MIVKYDILMQIYNRLAKETDVFAQNACLDVYYFMRDYGNQHHRFLIYEDFEVNEKEQSHLDNSFRLLNRFLGKRCKNRKSIKTNLTMLYKQGENK